MAKVPNPLHVYRGSQYHFVLMCAKDDVALTNIDKDEDVSDLSRYLHPEGGPQYKYDTKDVSGSTYIVVYNSMKDVEFSIDSVTLDYGLSLNGSTHSYNATNEQGVSLKIEIVEPYTADFIGVLEVVASNLGLPGVQELHYGLKIIFMGYPDDNNTSKPHVISDVNLLTFVLTEIKMSMTNRGCHYDIECTPLFNSAANHHSIGKIGGMSTTLPEAIPDAITKYENELNNNTKLSQEAFPDQPTYKYKVVLDPAYNDPKYKMDIVSDDQRNTFNGTQPLTKNNTPSEKPQNFTDQTAQSTSSIPTQSTQNTQSQKNSTGVLNQSQYDMATINYGEDKLRVMDQTNYQKYKDYRDNLFNQSISKGQDPDTSLQNAKIDAATKFDSVIAKAITDSLTIPKR
jgi:hypothetical protein